MRGDFSRLTFDRSAGFTQVLFQQGQDLVESEFNEQAAILRDQIRATGEFAALVQRTAGPRTLRFTKPLAIEGQPGKLTATITMDGWIFVPGAGRVWLGQRNGGAKDYTFPIADKSCTLAFVLDTTEEPVRAEADPNGLLHDPALAGGDGALRLRPAHRLRAIPNAKRPPSPELGGDLSPLLLDQFRPGKGLLRPVLGSGDQVDSTDDCAPLAEDQFQGVENQLYRVEVHAVRSVAEMKLELKMSRDNAAVAYRVDNIDDEAVGGLRKLKVQIPAASWSNDQWKIQPGDTVELFPATKPGVATADPPATPLKLLTVEEIDADVESINLVLTGWDKVPNPPAATAADYPLLIRWDHVASPLQVFGGLVADLATGSAIVPIEDDLSVEFTGSADSYKAGDYWLIPVRAATHEALWPKTNPPDVKKPYQSNPPHGPWHNYTPLAVVNLGIPQPLAEPYPWDAPVLPDEADVQPTVVAGAADAGGNLEAIAPTDPKISAAVLAKQMKLLVPVQHVFSIRQLLVLFLGDKGDPTVEFPSAVTAPQFAELARRLSFDPAQLPKLIAKRVSPLVVKAGVDTFLKSGGANTDFLDKMELVSLQPLNGDVKAKLIGALATIGALADVETVDKVMDKIKAAGATEAAVTADAAKIKTVWTDARIVQFYILAWPFKTITNADWVP